MTGATNKHKRRRHLIRQRQQRRVKRQKLAAKSKKQGAQGAAPSA